MNGRLLITACCCLLLSPARAQDRDTTATAEHRNGWTNILGNALHNPAFMHAAYTTSLSEMYLNVSYRQANKPQQAQTGDGHTLGNIAVSSYLKLSPNTTVWGGASYQTGRKRNIRFNSTSDYDRNRLQGRTRIPHHRPQTARNSHRPDPPHRAGPCLWKLQHGGRNRHAHL